MPSVVSRTGHRTLEEVGTVPRILRIGVASPLIQMFSGGAQRLWKLAQGLSDLGHQVALYRPFPDPPYLSRFLSIYVRRYPLSRAMEDPLDVLFFGNPTLKDLTRSPARLKVWLMQGCDTLDFPFWESPRLAKIACASWLYEVGRKRGPRMHCVPGGIDLNEFTFTTRSPEQPLGAYLREGAHRLRRPPPKPPLPHLLLQGIPQDKRAEWFQQIGVFWNHDYPGAGWSNPVAEAMASGCPVVTNDVPCTEDLVVDETVGCRCQSPQEGLETVLHWRKNPAEALQVAMRARARLAPYSWENWVQRVHRVLWQELSKLPD